MICCIATKSNARKKTNAIGTGLVKRLRTQTFSMQVSTTQKNQLLKAVPILLNLNILNSYAKKR